jgi:nucleoporin p58/p45
LATVDEFTKHVKNQKSVRENIARMSSKPLFRIQEDAKNLRQQLLLVSSELQRNAAAIAKLKRETGQELKHAEIALRTKETPPGLQYENTAPTEYFHHLADEFETQMQIYRQQIVETENHLASADQSSSLSPQDLSVLLNKLNEGFIALAAQLQVTHEAVKEQKEAYLSYRRTFHGDTTNVFDCHSSTQGTLLKNYPNIPSTVGPTPFSYMSNSAAVAMAAALNRTQHTTGSSVNVSTLGGSTLGSVAGQVLHQSTGSSGFNIGSTFGSVGTQQPFSLGSSALGSQPLGTLGSSTVGASPFGTPAAFGTTQPSTGSFGFALQKTPSGSKRGKNA